jgi:parallel beta-helix repeat protein
MVLGREPTGSRNREMRRQVGLLCAGLGAGRTRGLLGLMLLATALAVGCGQDTPQEAPQQAAPRPDLRPSQRTVCDLYAATRGADSAGGGRARPFRTARRLVEALHSGQTGCFRAGTYGFAELSFTKPNLTLAPYDRETVTLRGTIQVQPGGAGTTIEGMKLDGAGGTSDIGPRIYGDNVVLRGNEITNDHTAICVSVTNWYSDPPPQGVVIEANRIHDCGELPSTNKQHGIYVAEAVGTVIRDNWIYDNADRGIQLYPNAQRSTITGNVIDGNGNGVVFSGAGGVTSNDNVVAGNVIANSRDGFNAYSGPGPTATGNVLRNNCVWAGDGDTSNGGIETPSRNFTARSNIVVDPQYADGAAHDYTLSSESECPLAGRLAFSGGS